MKRIRTIAFFGVVSALALLAFAQQGQLTLQSIETRAPSTYIADGEGRALYTLVSQDGGEVTIPATTPATGGDMSSTMTGGDMSGGMSMTVVPCTGDCATAWPPLTTEGSAADISTAGFVDASLIGTTTREDGSTQVTYNGYPLYYFSQDGDTGGTVSGQSLESFGGVWYVVSPDGDPVVADTEDAGN